MTILFASLHQTATIIIWVTYYLALRPESQEAIWKESKSITRLGARGEQMPLNQRKMQEMTATDSFVREVLRMKGDSNAGSEVENRPQQQGQGTLHLDLVDGPVQVVFLLYLRSKVGYLL
ncbi:hypothetical protein N7493_002267 [Penicillium malachiteum]|uniref:Uncharacterized protein n=1 Tax=Penicillium malachiteum TaxID=1324776 RepID=A0AAD6MYJ8_9EURO|nr:hypothetical protein N7493_002267 [Penicillium malachiteum]